MMATRAARIAVAVVVAAFGCGGRTAVAPMREAPDVPPFRLPHTFEPREITARLSLGETSFEGRIELDGELVASSQVLWLHAVDLAIHAATATHGDQIVPLAVTRDAGQLIGLRPARALAPGRWRIAITYTGPLDARPRPFQETETWALGAFRRVVDGHGYVFTRSEPIGARRIFPCIDEPDRKVPWRLSLEIPADAIAVSNAPIAREQVTAGRKLVEFGPTPPVPSYLVAFAVGPFDVVDAGRSRGGAPLRLLLTKGRAAAAAGAGVPVRAVLAWMEDRLGVAFPYPKLDLVAIHGLGFGATSSPALVTIDEGLLSARTIRSAAARELARQWFGGLVTPRWWDDRWLSDSFTDLLWRENLVGPRSPQPIRSAAALVLRDSTDLAAPIVHPTQLRALGSTRSDAADRGTALLAVVQARLGAAEFRRRVAAYLTAHAHGNATTADLARVLGASGPLTSAVLGVVHGPPPILGMRLVSSNGGARVVLEPTPWPIPVCVVYDRDGRRDRACAQAGTTTVAIALPAAHRPRWVLPDSGATTLYRIRWTADLVEPLVTHGWTSLTETERRALLDALEDRALQLRVLVELAERPGALTIGELAHLASELAPYVPRELRPAFGQWILRVAGPAPSALPAMPVGDDALKLQLRLLAGDPATIAQARRWATNVSTIPWLLVEPVLTAVAELDPGFAGRLIDAPPGSLRRDLAMRALPHARNIVDVLASDHARLLRLEPGELERWVAEVCDPAALATLEELGPYVPKADLPRAIDHVRGCVEQRRRLAPTFRAWLAP